MSDLNNVVYSFQLPSTDQVVRYTLRGLREDEIDSWSRFCEGVFSYKRPSPPPATYFARHYYNDPHRDASLIRVAILEDDGCIVASCRVFQRSIVSPCCGPVVIIAAGGIGEVCTAPEHRRRGLSSQLLRQALSAMATQDSCTPLKTQNMKLSFLHSAPTFFPVYQKAGYTSLRSRWSVMTIAMNTCCIDDISAVIQTASFPDDTTSLQALHRQYSEQRFVGCIVRSEAYWNEYISKELQNFIVMKGEDSTILGWMSIRPRNDCYQLCEFGCVSRVAVHRVFLPLLKHALKTLDASMPDTIQLQIPTAVVEDVTSQGPIKWISKVEQEYDMGWMYKNLEESQLEIQLNTEKDHLIWPSDSF
jgi:predicted GNAT family N-acyltransferase